MKKLLPLTLPMLLMFSSCSSAQKNTAKLKGADLVADVAEKQVIKSAAGFAYPNSETAAFCATNVPIEAKYLSLKVRDAVDKALNAQRPTEGLFGLSAGESALRLACKFALSDLAPKLLNAEYDKYPCLIQVATSKTDDLICGSSRID